MLRWYQGTGGVGAHVGIAVRGALGPIDDEQLFERETQAACQVLNAVPAWGNAIIKTLMPTTIFSY